MAMPQENSNDFNEQDVMYVRMMIEEGHKCVKMCTHEWHMGLNQEMKNHALEMYTMYKDMIGKLHQWLMDRGISDVPDIEEMHMEH